MTNNLRKSILILKRDPRFAPIVRKYGKPDLTRYFGGIGIFPALLRSIVYQQLSGHAARAILARVLVLFPRGKPTPRRLIKLPAGKLRAAGLSVQKISYVRDLAHKCLDGTIDEKQFPTMSSEEIVQHLTQVRGVGQWSAHMVLIFTLHRLDILPTGDLGIRKGFQILYKLRTLPDKKKMESLARPWHAHASIASWYLWQIADENKK
ncbi:MAG: DNA-3-methyladenine glycosylase 2 family protein [Candidatus Kaiserbacteria bacterium]|nr:MAG: DNA-3-methyladenine glycosylase 2 family protein [Candidatus Kaiserbacteria bacterium]